MLGHSRRSIALVAVVVAVAVVALGVFVGLKAKQSSVGSGKVLVLLTVALPVPSLADPVTTEVTGLRLLPAAAGSSWVQVGAPPQKVSLPGKWTAPNTDNLFLADVRDLHYKEAQLELRSPSGTTTRDTQRVSLRVTSARLTPLLFTFRVTEAMGTADLADAAAYGGSDEVNFGIQLAQKKVLTVPPVSLENQSSRPVSLSQYHGKVVILVSFLTECQETCPLVDAALLQLEKTLRARDLQNSVQIVEVTQDPAADTPAILTKYQRYFSLPWPLLTGTSTAINQFWSGLGVPPIELLPWNGPAAFDRFTGSKEPYNIVHTSVLDVISPAGYVVAEVQGQPTLSQSSIPKDIYSYLDAQGVEEQKAGGAWNPSTVLQVVDGLLQQELVPGSFPGPATAPVAGQPAPAFTLASTAGGPVSLHSLLGHPVMLDFWATWCTNCQADMKLVAATAAQYQSQGLKVELIDYQESSSTVTHFLCSLGVTIPSLLDPHGSVASKYGVPGLPVAVFISAAGKITAIQLGQLQKAQLSQDLPAILK